MRRRALLSVVGAAAFAGCGGRLGDDDETETETDTETTTRETTTEPSPRVELAAHELVRSNEGSDAELATVVGEVRNVADETVPEAAVAAAFLDADGETLDRATASVSDLAAGRTWSFELVYPGTGEDARAVADYELSVETSD